MICVNPDRFAHEGNPPRAVVRQGSIALMHEEQGGQVFYIGKPADKMYFAAMESFLQFGVSNRQKGVNGWGYLLKQILEELKTLEYPLL